MIKRIALLIVLLSISGLFTNQSANASSTEPLSKDKVFEFIEEAFQAQSSLTFEFRSYNEVREILSPYFHDRFASLFLEGNLIEEENGYIIYGSDFALYFIPFYSYSEKTKVIYDEVEQKIYVYELFRSPTSGPVGYKDHYEIVTLSKGETNWLISDITKSDKEPSITSEKQDDEESDSIKDTVENNNALSNPLSRLLIWNPYKTTLYSLLEMDNRTPLYAGCFKGIF